MRSTLAGRNHQAEKSRKTRERVITSTVGLIRREGLLSASPSRITQHVGMSWGAVQHHFGSKEQLLKKIVLLSRDQFHEAVSVRDYSALSLVERISLFVDSAWQHYQGDVFLASVEITFWHRNNGQALSEDIASDDGRTSHLTRAVIERVFEGTDAQTNKLIEATVYMHCVLTGLAFQKILASDRTPFLQHLAHCKDAMMKIVLGN